MVGQHNTAHALYYRHTLRIRNNYCFSNATMVARKRPIVTLYVHCVSYVKRSCLFFLLPANRAFNRNVRQFTDYWHQNVLCERIFLVRYLYVNSPNTSRSSTTKKKKPTAYVQRNKYLFPQVWVFQVMDTPWTNQISEAFDVLRRRLHFVLWSLPLVRTIPGPMQALCLIYE